MSALLQKKRRSLAQELEKQLSARGMTIHWLPGTKDIWVRDFMPVRTASGRWISFRYEPWYLDGWSHLRTDYRRDMAPHVDLSVVYSNINLDGGNVVFSPSRRRVIISERIFWENPEREPKALVQELEQLLEAEVVLIPALSRRDDMTGHADGMVRFLNEDTVLGNTPVWDGALEADIRQACAHSGLATLDFPYYLEGWEAFFEEGTYLNYLETEKCILLQVYDSHTDQEAIALAERLFNKEIVPIPCKELAEDGGGLNCISWEV